MTPEEEATLAPQPSANELLAGMLPGAPQPEATETAVTETAEMPAEQMQEAAAGTEQAPVAQPPAPDPNAQAIQQLAEAQAQLEALKAQLPDDNQKRLLQIANAGPEAWEEYMSLKNMDYSKMSPLDLLQRQFMEKRVGMPYDQAMDVFHDRMRIEFPDYDPTDSENNFGLSLGAQDMIGERADAYRSQKEAERQEKLLAYQNKVSKPNVPDFTDDEHQAYAERIADSVLNMKALSVKDADGNQIDLDVTEIPGYDQHMKDGLLTSGPERWIRDNLLMSDDKNREMVNPEAVTELIALKQGLPFLLKKAAQVAADKVRAEIAPQKEAELRKVVDTTLGVAGADAKPQGTKNANELLMDMLQNQRQIS